MKAICMYSFQMKQQKYLQNFEVEFSLNIRKATRKNKILAQKFIKHHPINKRNCKSTCQCKNAIITCQLESHKPQVVMDNVR